MKMNSVQAFTRSRVLVRPHSNGNRFQMVLAVDFHDLRLILDLDVRRSADFIDEVLRHGGSQRRAAHEHDDAFGVTREVQRRLSRGVCAAYDIDIVVRGRRPLRWNLRRNRHRRRSNDPCRERQACAIGLPWRSAGLRRRFRSRRQAYDPVGILDAQARRLPAGARISAPKRRAWVTARRARSLPLIPEGKPR